MSFFSGLLKTWTGDPYGGVSDLAGAGGGGGGGSEWAAKKKKVMNAAAASGGGTFGGMVYRGRPLLDPGPFIDPTYGNEFQYNGPFLAAAQLNKDFGPGGYLAPEAQSYESAMGVSGILGSSRQSAMASLNRLGASGLSRRYALGVSGGIEDQGLSDATAYSTERTADLGRSRFEAMQAFLNMVNQNAVAEKAARANYKIAKGAAKSNQTSGLLGLAGGIGGAVLGGPVGAAIGSSVGSQVGEQWDPLGGGSSGVK